MVKTLFPHFTDIQPEKIVAQLDAILQQNLERIAQLVLQKNFTWENLIAPLETLEDQLDQFWAPIAHLNSVMNNEALREAYNDCLPKLSDYATELGQNYPLYLAYQYIRDHHYTGLDTAQKAVIDHALRDFTLSGVALTGKAKQQYQHIQQELSQLTTKFEENILDATNAWQHHVTDEQMLVGLPEHALALAKQSAEEKKLSGWLLTLQMPCYQAVITYADSAALRELMYRAYVTRASELDADTQYDNSATMQEILALRLQLAQLLGFNNFAEYSLATKMAKQPAEVLEFLNHLVAQAKPKAQQEFAELQEFARREYGVMQLQAWDVSYYAEKLQQQRYNISQEQLRPYFPQPVVLSGMFAIIGKLYGMSVMEMPDVNTWHPDVKCYQVNDQQQQIRGYVYMDLYARQSKRGGAWMDDCVTRRKLPDGSVQVPIAFLTCNFSAPVGDQPALFTHDEVITLFHEFGHTLHHILTQINYTDVAGINGVPWDAVELPSQFFENWCWDKTAINLIAQHYQTNEPLPETLLQQMLAAKNFHAALYLVRQLEFALFDFQLHLQFDPQQANQVQKILNQVRQQVAVIQPPAFNRFQHNFAHIFSGGYAAGYYSYLWAEVLSCDAFGAFLEQGIFDHTTGRKFLHEILEQGGSREPMELFCEFRGRKPTVDALLQQHGIVVT